MKILIVMGGYFPGKNYGGPPVSTDNFCTLMENNDCYIVTKNHDLGSKKKYLNIKKGWNDRGNCKVLYLSDNEYGYKRFEKVIEEIKPNVIYLQSLFQNCIIPCLKLSKKYSIPVLLALRGELCKGAFKKKYKKIPYIYYLRMLDLLSNVDYQSTSEEETMAIKKYMAVDSNKIHHITNVPSIPAQNYIHKEKIKGRINIVFLSRIHPKKNLKGALSFLKNLNGEVIFDIYGPIEDKKYWEECKNVGNSFKDNISINYCGLVSHERVHEIFSRYDVFLFPTFSENYGHVIVEALMVGTPVIISDQTPWNDIQTCNAGWAISLENSEIFERSLQKIIDMDEKEYDILSNASKNYIKEKTKLELLRKKYNDLFNNLDSKI